VLGSAITQVHGGSSASSPYPTSPEDVQLPVVTIPGVDYVPPVSPAYIGQSGYGVILVQTLPDPRASSFRRAYSLVVTLEAGAGYAIGEAKSAQIMIKP